MMGWETLKSNTIFRASEENEIYLSSKFSDRSPSLLDDLRHFPKHNDRHRVDVPRKPPISRDSY